MSTVTEKEVKDSLQREGAERRQRVREVIAETDHPDKDKIIAEFDRNMWDIETGVMQARGIRRLTARRQGAFSRR